MDAHYTYSYDVVLATTTETLHAYPHCSAYCANQTLQRFALPDIEPDNDIDAFAFVMPFSEHETFGYLYCHQCSEIIGGPDEDDEDDDPEPTDDDPEPTDGEHVGFVTYDGSEPYPWRTACTCGWVGRGYMAEHAAQSVVEDHESTEHGTDSTPGMFVYSADGWTVALDPNHHMASIGVELCGSMEGMAKDFMREGITFLNQTMNAKGLSESDALAEINKGGTWAILSRDETTDEDDEVTETACEHAGPCTPLYDARSYCATYPPTDEDDEDDEDGWSADHAIATVEALGVHALGRMADVRAAADGLKFLDLVRETFIEWLGCCGADCPEDVERMSGDAKWDNVESAIPVYDADLWTTFADLGAWSEDVSEYVRPDADMDSRGRFALTLIGERLWDALVVVGTEDVAA